MQDTPDDERPDVLGDPSEIEEAGRPVTEGEDDAEEYENDFEDDDLEDTESNTADEEHNAGNSRMSIDEEGPDVSADEQV